MGGQGSVLEVQRSRSRCLDTEGLVRAGEGSVLEVQWLRSRPLDTKDPNTGTKLMKCSGFAPGPRACVMVFDRLLACVLACLLACFVASPRRPRCSRTESGRLGAAVRRVSVGPALRFAWPCLVSSNIAPPSSSVVAWPSRVAHWVGRLRFASLACNHHHAPGGSPGGREGQTFDYQLEWVVRTRGN